MIEHDRMHSFYLNHRLIELNQCLNIFGFIGFQFPCFSLQTDNSGGCSEMEPLELILMCYFLFLRSRKLNLLRLFMILSGLGVLLRANIGILLSPFGATGFTFP